MCFLTEKFAVVILTLNPYNFFFKGHHKVWEAHRGAFRWYIARVCDINFLPQCCQSTKPPAFSSPNGPPFPTTWLPNLLSFLPVRKLLHRFCSILCPKCMAFTRDTWYRLWRRHIYDSPVALTPRILLLCSKLFIGRTKFCGKGGTTPKVQLWNIFGRAHKKRRKTEIITWWQNIISSLGKNFAVVWRRFWWLGKCLKNYEKCVAKKK